MKCDLHLTTNPAGDTVIEIRYGGEVIGQVTTPEGPGVRVISRYPAKAVTLFAAWPVPHIIDVEIEPHSIAS